MIDFLNARSRSLILLILVMFATPSFAAETVPHSFGAAADAAVATLEQTWYAPSGRWNACVPNGCGTVTRDWGADALIYTLFLRWKTTHDPSVVPLLTAFTKTAPSYGPCRLKTCGVWSDIPMWDSIADSREFEVTGDFTALRKAQQAFAMVDGSDAFARGACPQIDYQRPGGGPSALKTLETDSNYIKAALLLQHWTGDSAYLRKARTKYASVRRYFRDPTLALYTVYLFDDRRTCRPVPGRFYASVNGTMIYNALTLAQRTGDRTYLADAVATAQAVTQRLGDAAGYFANLQADNDVAEPLIEAMYDLAAETRIGFARDWLLANAAVLTPTAAGSYGRFFDGPAPPGPVSIWSTNGGFALAIAAGALERAGTPGAGVWQTARFIADPIAEAPATIAFTGRAIALIGTIGDVCCEPGHVRVVVDGSKTVDTTGIWQNKSPASRALPNSVLFSWRWPATGRHSIELLPGLYNAKEGGSAIHMQGYALVP